MVTGYIQEMIFMDFKIGAMIPTIKTMLSMDTLDMISVKMDTMTLKISMAIAMTMDMALNTLLQVSYLGMDTTIYIIAKPKIIMALNMECKT